METAIWRTALAAPAENDFLDSTLLVNPDCIGAAPVGALGNDAAAGGSAAEHDQRVATRIVPGTSQPARPPGNQWSEGNDQHQGAQAGEGSGEKADRPVQFAQRTLGWVRAFSRLNRLSQLAGRHGTGNMLNTTFSPYFSTSISFVNFFATMS